MTHTKWLCVLGVVFLMCAAKLPGTADATQEKQQNPPAAEKEAPPSETEKEIELKACGPADIKHSAETDKSQHPTPAAPPDKALIYVVRPTMMGNKIQTNLSVDQKWVGVNRGDNYFYFTLDPGEHYFCSTAENHSVLALKVEAGKTYYLQQKVRMGFMKAGNHLAVITAEEGQVALSKTHPSIMEEK